MVAISTNAFIFSFPYVRDGIIRLGAWSIEMMLDAAWRKKFSLLTCEKGTRSTGT